MSRGYDDEFLVLPGRLQRLAEELDEEGLPALDGAPDRIAALVELAYALRPHLHEGRVPSYGALLPPRSLFAPGFNQPALDTVADLIPVHDLDLQFARRFADGITSFAVRSHHSVDHLACFGRSMAGEYDLVGLQARIGGLIIQRHPAGQVRLFGPSGVVRWNGTTWHHDAPMDAWIKRLRAVAPGLPVDGVRPLLRFAVHKLGGRGIGATLIWRPTEHDVPAHRHEPLVHNAPRLRLDHIGEEAALAQALSQTDGAAIFDRDVTLSALAIRLAPSTSAERAIGAIGGMRHTSALRYSYDDPHSIVIVVSDAGPVTLMHAGRAITSVDPAEEKIG
ncbi:diadenylate cyclase [Ilumatobacter sp.]|uniref:diadenylate cyclase n=1 Tax=Ilumatobacter sp. TaxID=1967498 RepID=UPI003C5727AA